MPIGTQAKLLRVLGGPQTASPGQPGGNHGGCPCPSRHQQGPEEAVAKGELRDDLYYRLNVFNVDMPPLREHKDDIPELVQTLMHDMNASMDEKLQAVSEAVLNAFNNYSWPGNVRELRNTLERAIIVCDGAMIETRHLPPGFGQTIRARFTIRMPSVWASAPPSKKPRSLLILKTLEATSNNKTRAAEILGISLKTLHNKLKEYGARDAGRPDDEGNRSQFSISSDPDKRAVDVSPTHR